MTIPHITMVFQVLTVVLIGLTMQLIKENIKLLDLRRELRHTVDFSAKLQRHINFIECFSLCWAVVYGHINGWEPWSPMVVYVIVRCVNIVSQTLSVRCEIAHLEERLDRLRAISSRRQSRQGARG